MTDLSDSALPAKLTGRRSGRGRPSALDTSPSESLLIDPGYVRLIRWVFTARLVCLALASPVALLNFTGAPLAAISLLLLAVSSAVFSRSDNLIRTLIRHPVLASVDTAISVALLVSIPVGQPAAMTVVCSALAAGLLFPGRALVLLMIPLAVGSLGAPATVVATGPPTWQGWLALVAGLPALVLGVGVVGSMVRRNVNSLVQARLEVAEAVAAIGAADERARLARDMHDSVGKSIHGISLGAKALAKLVDSDPRQARDLAGTLADSADRAAREARTLLLTLREGQDDRPTVEVISEILTGWQRETSIETRFGTIETVDAAPVVTHQMAYALREILHNIDKHARADSVEVSLTGDDELITLTVADDGIGFDLDRASYREAGGHYGLRGLRERAAQVGGTVDITTAKRRGTTIKWTAQRHPVGHPVGHPSGHPEQQRVPR